ncbi:MAG: isocitrate lyase/phosphoenolpyruvate mutase family protein [Polyangiaceae bacterium]|nr:isocitrate lyase/phosphoenolpyruvate mutase family protein [Polyangiaceae bacterium]
MTRAIVETLRTLHGGAKTQDHGGVLVLANAWDALSARLVEEEGAAAIATGSAAVAWARGYRDGEDLPLEELVGAARSIARVAKPAVTVDFERGYAAEPALVASNVARLVDVGVAGINLEDEAKSADLLGEKIAAVRRRFGADIFINARTCVVLHGKVDQTQGVEEVLARARVFAEAGADGLFVPGLVDRAAIQAVARGTSLPLNVMLFPGLPTLTELASLGVRRLSIGPWLAELAYASARRAARALLRDGSYDAIFGGSPLAYPEVNALFPAAPTPTEQS